MEKTAFAANRAVTFDRFDLRGRFDFELDPTAMAAAFVLDQPTWHVCLELLQSGWAFQASVRWAKQDNTNSSHGPSKAAT
jgi:hypothetical protein